MPFVEVFVPFVEVFVPFVEVFVPFVEVFVPFTTGATFAAGLMTAFFFGPKMVLPLGLGLGLIPPLTPLFEPMLVLDLGTRRAVIFVRALRI